MYGKRVGYSTLLPSGQSTCAFLVELDTASSSYGDDLRKTFHMLVVKLPVEVGRTLSYLIKMVERPCNGC